MAATDLEYVPRPVASPTGPSCFEDADGVWELQTWVPGQATLSAAAPEELLLSAVETISRLHRAWSSLATQSSHSPTLRRRAQRLKNLCEAKPAAFDLPTTRPEIPFAPQIAAIQRLLPDASRTARAELDRIEHHPRRLHPVVIDLKCDHVLFTANRVTGIVDFGAMAIDTPAVDWARLISSVAGDNPDAWRLWGDAVVSQHPAAEGADLRRLLPALDASGTVLAADNWVAWLSDGWRPPVGAEGIVRSRLEALTGRLRTLAGGKVVAR